MVVLVVIGILFTVVVVAYNGIQTRAIDTAVAYDANNMNSAQQLYKATHGGSAKAYYSGNGVDGDLEFRSSNENVVDVVVDGKNYCIRTYNTKGTNNSIQTALLTESSPGICATINASAAAFADSPGPTFLIALGDTLTGFGNSITKTSDGGYAVTGYAEVGTSSVYKMLIAKYDLNGNLAWANTWADNSVGRSIIQTSDGGYAVTGHTYSYGGGNSDMILTRFSSDGTIIWSRIWGGSGLWGDVGYSLVQTSDGGFAVTGETYSFGSGNYDMFLVKYGSDGTLVWDKTWGGASSDKGRSLVQTSDGGYAVTGSTSSYGAGGDDMFVAKYASDGTLLWSQTWGSTGNYYEYGYSLTQTSDGGLAVTGKTGGNIGVGNDMFIVKYSSSGTFSWDATWGCGPNLEYGNSITQTSDGGYVVAGSSGGYGAGGTDIFLAKFSSVGISEWSRMIGGTGDEYAQSIAAANDGGLAITGRTESFGAGGADMFIAKLDPEGTITNCSFPMCRIPTATVTDPVAVTSAQSSVGETNPSPTISSPVVSITAYSATPTVIVAP
ncbi:MAG: hypothetical protein WA087_00400 [Candidatus Saccharimonadales bacterium]